MKHKNSIIFFIFTIIISFTIISLSILCIKQTYREKELEYSIAQSEYVNLFYLYGVPNHKSIKNLYTEENLLNKLERFNKELNNLENGEFIEIKDTFIQLKGLFNYDYNYIYGYDSTSDNKEFTQEYINQQLIVNGNRDFYSNVKSIRIGEKAYNKLISSTSITEGRYFNSDDFIINNTPLKLNVILGYKYNSIFNLNDEFTALYMGEEINFKVIGFLKEGTTINIDPKTKANLDYYIIFPSFNLNLPLFINNQELNEFAISHYLEKNYGNIIPNNRTDIRAIINTINNLINSIDLDYKCFPNSSASVDFDVFSDLFSNPQIVILFLIVTVILTLFMSFIERKYYKSIHSQRKKTIYFNIFIIFIIGYISAAIIYYLFNKNNVSIYMFIDALKITFLIITIIFLNITFILKYILNKLLEKQI